MFTPKNPPPLQLTDYQIVTNNFVLPPYSVATFRVPASKGESLLLETTTEVQSKRNKNWLGTLAGALAVDATRISSTENGKNFPRISVTALATPTFLVRRPQPKVYLQVRRPDEVIERTANARRSSDRLALSTEITASGEVEVSLVNEGNAPVVISNLKQTLTKPPMVTEKFDFDEVELDVVTVKGSSPRSGLTSFVTETGAGYVKTSGGGASSVDRASAPPTLRTRFPIEKKCDALKFMYSQTEKNYKEQGALIVKDPNGNLFIEILPDFRNKDCEVAFPGLRPAMKDPNDPSKVIKPHYGSVNYEVIAMIHTHTGFCDMSGPSLGDVNQLNFVNGGEPKLSNIPSYVFAMDGSYEVTGAPRNPLISSYGNMLNTKNEVLKDCKLPF